jgi:hypothetical protein
MARELAPLGGEVREQGSGLRGAAVEGKVGRQALRVPLE